MSPGAPSKAEANRAPFHPQWHEHSLDEERTGSKEGVGKENEQNDSPAAPPAAADVERGDARTNLRRRSLHAANFSGDSECPASPGGD